MIDSRSCTAEPMSWMSVKFAWCFHGSENQKGSLVIQILNISCNMCHMIQKGGHSMTHDSDTELKLEFVLKTSSD
jgi:hypothetical protein